MGVGIDASDQVCYVICRDSDFLNIFLQFLAFKPEMTPLMTFDLFFMNTPYEARVNNSSKKV